MSADRTSLRRLVLRGSGLIIGSHGGGQLIRLARSLILTRLLFPEAFGVMSLVWVVMFGLGMLSDLGVGPAIIRDKRGEDPDFLNTAWTLQVIRGVVLLGIACLIAYPMATFYNEPDLAQLIPAAGLFALIAGFNSTAFHTCQ
jgi:O-antigen/teichoic acid export membrane protein